jgi:hypothetical protein
VSESDSHPVPLYVYSNDELRRLADGCTELTCLYHGAYNAELVARGAPRRTAGEGHG